MVPVKYVLFMIAFFTVDGNFSQWSEFSECTRSCGTGTRFRTRTCDNPAPRFGGSDCTVRGEDSQTYRCNMNPCPGIELGLSAFNIFLSEKGVLIAVID